MQDLQGLIDSFDSDQAVGEAADRVSKLDTRAGFLKKAGLGAGAVLGGGALMGALPGIASAGVAASDVAILNYALTLEYLESAFYAEALSMGKISDKNVLAFAQVVAKHEALHVSLPEGRARQCRSGEAEVRLQGHDRRSGEVHGDRPGPRGHGRRRLSRPGRLIKSKKILGAAGSILPVEARHAGWIRNLNGVTRCSAGVRGTEDQGAGPGRRQGDRLHRRLAQPTPAGASHSTPPRPSASTPNHKGASEMPGFIGLPEIMLLALLALVLFGPKRLPEMGRGLGKGLREFKESVGGDHAGLHGIDIDKLAVPVDRRDARRRPQLHRCDKAA